MKRSTTGGLAGLLAAFAQYMAVPPTVMQELLKLVFGWTVSVDLAGFIGTLLAGLVGWAAAEFQRDKTSTEQVQAHVDLAVTATAQESAEQQIAGKG